MPPSFTLPVVKEVAADRSPPPFSSFSLGFGFLRGSFMNRMLVCGSISGSVGTGVWIFVLFPTSGSGSLILPEAGLPVPLPLSATDFDKLRFT